jgi:hypothetical protein
MLDPVGCLEQGPCVCEGGDHQAVPVCEHFVVEAGAHATAAGGKQRRAQFCETFFIRIRSWNNGEPVEDVVPLEVSGGCHVIVRCEEGGVVLAEGTLYFR